MTNRSIIDILRLNPKIERDWTIIKTEYIAQDIEKVVIDGDTFTNYGNFQFVWEKSYVEEPKRSSGGNLGNLNSLSTFVTPHLIIDFSIMSIDDYRAIMRKDLERNEFIVECYDPIYNRKIKQKMYFATPQMAKLYTLNRKRFDGEKWEEFIELAGVHEYTVEMIGTNNDIDFVSVRYIVNPPIVNNAILTPDKAVDTGEDDIYNGEDVIIGQSASDIVNETFGGRYTFSKWNISANPQDKDKDNYINGNVYTINQPPNNTLVLYAQWKPTTDHILSYNYGIADALIDDSNNSYIYNKTVVKGESIGLLPIVATPTVEIDKQVYSPYTNGKWYKTPIKAPNSVALTDNELYWLDRDSSIYLIYDIKSYKISYYIDGELHSTDNIQYNSLLALPKLVKNGYEFDGWYYKSDFTGNKASGNMPPYDIPLYARWIKK